MERRKDGLSFHEDFPAVRVRKARAMQSSTVVFPAPGAPQRIAVIVFSSMKAALSVKRGRSFSKLISVVIGRPLSASRFSRIVVPRRSWMLTTATTPKERATVTASRMFASTLCPPSTAA